MAFSSGRAVFTMSASERQGLSRPGGGGAARGTRRLPRPRCPGRRTLRTDLGHLVGQAGLAAPSAPDPQGLGKGQGCGNWIRRRPLPLPEDGLEGLKDSQLQGPPEARDMGPGWGWCWLERGRKRKKQNSTLAAGTAGRGEGTAWAQEAWSQLLQPLTPAPAQRAALQVLPSHLSTSRACGRLTLRLPWAQGDHHPVSSHQD